MKSPPPISPPSWLLRFFRWFCHPDFVEDIEGDLCERFSQHTESTGVRKARWRFLLEVLLLCRPGIIRPFSGIYYLMNTGMFKNYVKVGVRNIAKHKLFSVLNIFGLSLAMSVTLLVVVLLDNVMHFDSFQVNKDRIYRVYTEESNQNGKEIWGQTLPQLAGPLMQNETVAEVVQVNSQFRSEVTYQSKKIPLSGYLADEHFFEVFSYPFLMGSADDALRKPYSIVLTEAAAHKIFSDKNPIGKLVTTDYGDFMVTGVIREPVENSHFSFEMLGSYATLASLERKGDIESSTWKWKDKRSDFVYVLLNESGHTDAVADQLAVLATEANVFQEDISLDFGLHDLREITFGPQIRSQLGPSYPILDSLLILGLTLLILLPGCFNYINLSIARSLKRGKEIGIRKIVGSSKNQIVLQFMVETFLISIIALIGSIVIVMLIKDEFMGMLAPASQISQIVFSASSFLFALMLALFTALLAGIVPAIYFSKLQPMESIAAKAKPGSFAGISVRKGLTVFQFALSLGFLIGVSSIIRQYQYTLTFDMGFDRENTLVIPLAGVDHQLLRHSFNTLSAVQSVTFSSHIPGTWGASMTTIREKARLDSLEMQEMYVDETYLDRMGIKLLKGKGLTSDRPEHIEWILVNQQFEEDFIAIDSSHFADKEWVLSGEQNAVVIGVVENFNISPIKEKIAPVMLRFNPDQFQYAHVSLQSTNIKSTLEELETKWESLSSAPFESKFLHHHVEDAFATYDIMIKILGFQGMLVIVISCLGLLGMVVFTTENRIKEMGIRKVLGASESGLIWLISKTFVKLLLIATAIGTPIAYLLFDSMLLQTQHYTVGVGWFEVFISVVIMFLLGGITIYWQTKKVAGINPADHLRNE